MAMLVRNANTFADISWTQIIVKKKVWEANLPKQKGHSKSFEINIDFVNDCKTNKCVFTKPMSMMVLIIEIKRFHVIKIRCRQCVCFWHNCQKHFPQKNNKTKILSIWVKQ